MIFGMPVVKASGLTGGFLLALGAISSFLRNGLNLRAVVPSLWTGPKSLKGAFRLACLRNFESTYSWQADRAWLGDLTGPGGAA